MELVKQDRHDSADTFISQAGGKEPYRPDNGPVTPVHLFQLIHAIDRPELPGWPLLAPTKVQMQKCSANKCHREFCSPINYRRHTPIHRRLRKLEKDSGKDRGLLGAFWDNLSGDKVKEIISLKDVNMEEVTGSSVVMALATVVQKPGLYALPDNYVTAGSRLLDVIQGAASISSEEFFHILDNASERNFLSSTANSMEKYVFDEEIGKSALEANNVVACASFLLEQKLVKAWVTDKDAEALRCQKKLVEEEEATQRRQEELLERKRRKRLKQKKQRAKVQRHDDTDEDRKESGNGASEELQYVADPPSLMSATSCSEAQRSCVTTSEDSSVLEIVVVSNTDDKTSNQETDDKSAYDNAQDNVQNVERRVDHGHPVLAMPQVPLGIEEEFIEIKRKKKLRQKEQRAKVQRHDEEDDKEKGSGTSGELQYVADPPSLISATSYSDAQRPCLTSSEDFPVLETVVTSNKDDKTSNHETSNKSAYDNSQDNMQNVERRVDNRHPVLAMSQVPPGIQEKHSERKRRKKLRQKEQRVKVQRHDDTEVYGKETGSGTAGELQYVADPPSLMSAASYSDAQRPCVTSSEDSSVVEIVIESNADDKTSNQETDDKSAYDYGQDNMQNAERTFYQSKSSELLIGSISVALGRDLTELDEKAENVSDKSCSEQSTVEECRPVSRQESKGPTPIENNEGELEPNLVAGKNEDLKETLVIDNDNGEIRDTLSRQENDVHQRSYQLSYEEARAFHAKRWKEAIEAEHIKPVQSSEAEIVDQKRRVLESLNVGSAKPEFRMKHAKGSEVKYIQKKRTG